MKNRFISNEGMLETVDLFEARAWGSQYHRPHLCILQDIWGAFSVIHYILSFSSAEVRPGLRPSMGLGPGSFWFLFTAGCVKSFIWSMIRVKFCLWRWNSWSPFVRTRVIGAPRKIFYSTLLCNLCRALRSCQIYTANCSLMNVWSNLQGSDGAWLLAVAGASFPLLITSGWAQS